jgi:hypothetical protein
MIVAGRAPDLWLSEKILEKGRALIPNLLPWKKGIWHLENSDYMWYK